MAGHPQGSNRGIDAAAALMIGGSTNSGTATLTANSTGLVLDGGLKIKNTTGQLAINSTSLAVKGNKLQIGSLSSKLVSSNSTGVKLAATYITGNSTGN